MAAERRSTPDEAQDSVNRRSGEEFLQAVHDQAVVSGRTTYVDPETGFSVFTSPALAARGYCCGSGCRHCPYDAAQQRAAGRPDA